MKKFCIKINGNNNNFLASHMSSFFHSKISSTIDPARENQYLNAFVTNMDFTNGYQTQATVTLLWSPLLPHISCT